MPDNSLGTNWDKFYGLVTGQVPGTMQRDNTPAASFNPGGSQISDLFASGSGGTGGSSAGEGTLHLASGGALTSHNVHTVPIDPTTGNPTTALQAINTEVPHASGTVDNNKLAYRQSPTTLNPPTPFDTRHAAVPASIPALYGPTGWVDSFFGDRLGGMPINSDVPLNIGDYSPAQVAALKTKYPPAAAASPSISDLYTPPPAAPPAERFLQDRGYNTSGMNATDRQTALNAALNGSANGGSRDMSVVPKSVRFQ